MDGQGRSRYRGLLLAVCAAAVLQTAIIARSPTMSDDGVFFAYLAQELEQAPLDTIRRQDQHPAFPALLLASTRTIQALGIRGDEPEAWITGGRIITFTCGLLSVVAVWLLARDLLDAHVANLAALVFAILPIPRDSASDPMSDTPHLFFYLLAAWLAASGLMQGEKLRLAAAGLASGIAYWFRPEGLEVAVVALPCLVVHGFRAGWGWRRVAATSGALASAAAIVVAPYLVLAGKFTSKQLPAAKAKVISLVTTLAQDGSPAPTIPAPSAPAVQPDAGGEHPVGLPPTDPNPTRIKMFGKALAAYITSTGQGLKWIFMFFYVVGNIELVRRRPQWPPIIYLALLGALHSFILINLFLLAGYIGHRHSLELVGLAMPIAALGLILVGNLAARLTGWRQPATHWATLVVCAAVVLPYTLRPMHREFAPVIEASRWVLERAEPGCGVISNSPYTPFYTELPTAYLSVGSPTLESAIAAVPTSARYDYVVLHVGAHAYRAQWLAVLERNYRTVHAIEDPRAPADRPRKVLVMEANDLQARRAGQPARS